jgi:hypothetical protein
MNGMEMKIEYLLMLIGLLFIIYFLLNMKETFAQFKTKEESDQAISDDYQNYIWNTPHFVR